MRISDWSSDVCSSDLHLNFGDVGTSEDAFSAHRQVTLLDRRKARGELETADISQRIEDHLLRHPIKVVGRRRAPPLRHVDADQAAEMILKWQLALTGHVEARLERPGNDIAKPGRAAIIGQRPKQIEAGDRIVTSTPAFVETGAELGKPAARRSILGFEADDRACWNRRSEEHTSELQSLMRNSYAVFCLIKNNISEANYFTHNSIVIFDV